MIGAPQTMAQIYAHVAFAKAGMRAVMPAEHPLYECSVSEFDKTIDQATEEAAKMIRTQAQLMGQPATVDFNGILLRHLTEHFGFMVALLKLHDRAYDEMLGRVKALEEVHAEVAQLRRELRELRTGKEFDA